MKIELYASYLHQKRAKIIYKLIPKKNDMIHLKNNMEHFFVFCQKNQFVYLSLVKEFTKFLITNQKLTSLASFNMKNFKEMKILHCS